VKGLRIGVPKEFFIDGMEKGVERAVRDALRWYEKEGAELVDVSLSLTDHGLAVYYIIQPAEASSNLARYDGMRFGQGEFAHDRYRNQYALLMAMGTTEGLRAAMPQLRTFILSRAG